MMEKQFIKLALEYWQMSKLTQSMMYEVPVESGRQKMARMNFLLRQFERLLNEHDLRLIEYTHQPYEVNLPVLVMNKEELDMGVELVITRTHVPTVIKNGKVLEMGKVFAQNVSK